MLSGGEYTKTVVQAHRSAEMHCPPLPAIETRQALLDAGDGARSEPLPDCPAWVATVCRHRDHFNTVSLVFGEGHSSYTFLLSHASQSPFWAAFYRLRDIAVDGAGSTGDAPSPLPREHNFYNMKIDCSEFIYESSPLIAEPPTRVVPYLCFESKALCWSEHREELFDNFVASLPEPKTSGKNKKEPKFLSIEDDCDVGRNRRRIINKTSLPAVLALAWPSASVALEDGELAAVFAAAVSALGEHDVSDEKADFLVEPYSGHCSGHAVSKIDCYRGKAHGELEKNWVEENISKGHRSITCALSKYDYEFAHALCSVWAAMMSQWFKQWMNKTAGTSLVYDHIDVRTLVPEGVLEKIGGHPKGENFSDRLAELQGIIPFPE